MGWRSAVLFCPHCKFEPACGCLARVKLGTNWDAFESFDMFWQMSRGDNIVSGGINLARAESIGG